MHLSDARYLAHSPGLLHFTTTVVRPLECFSALVELPICSVNVSISPVGPEMSFISLTKTHPARTSGTLPPRRAYSRHSNTNGLLLLFPLAAEDLLS